MRRKRRDSGGRFGAATVFGLALLCLTLGGFTGCEQGGDNLSGANKITSFTIDGVAGFIDDAAGTVKITVSATANVRELTPVIAVSEKATVVPRSGDEVDISYDKDYTVTAENGVTNTYKVSVIRLEAIAVEPLKTIYAKGDEWKTADVVVTGIYSDGSTRRETESYEVVGYDPAKEGVQTVAVVLNGKTATYDLSVRVVESISASLLKTDYAKGEALNYNSIVLTAHYNDGTTSTFSVAAENITGYDPEQEGPQTVTVTKFEKTTTFDVSVTALTSISVETVKDTYAYGASFNAADIVVWGTYSDGTRKILPPEDYTVSLDATHAPLTPSDLFSTAGAHTLVVTTANGKTATAQVMVDEKDEISITIGLPTEDEPVIFGVPAAGIKLSANRNNGLPAEIVISTANTYTNIRWYIDNAQQMSFSNKNIVKITAAGYTLKIPHTITFVGTKDGVEYSKTITFTVEW